MIQKLGLFVVEVAENEIISSGNYKKTEVLLMYGVF